MQGFKYFNDSVAVEKFFKIVPAAIEQMHRAREIARLSDLTFQIIQSFDDGNKRNDTSAMSQHNKRGCLRKPLVFVKMNHSVNSRKMNLEGSVKFLLF